MGNFWEGLDDMYAATAPATGGGALPDGEYTGQIVSLEPKQHPEYGTWSIEWCIETADGRKAWKTSATSENAMPYLRKDLELIGASGKLSEIIANLDRYIGTSVEFVIKTDKGGKKRCYLEKLCSPVTAGRVPANDYESLDDDIPFN